MSSPKSFKAFLVFLAGTVLLANPVVITEHQVPPDLNDISFASRAIIIAIALSVEIIIIFFWCLRFKPRRPLRLIMALILLHIISYPITLLLSLPLGIRAEVFPLVFEVWLFPQLASLSVRSTWIPVLSGNLVSFALGLVIPNLWVHFFLHPYTYVTYSGVLTW